MKSEGRKSEGGIGKTMGDPQNSLLPQKALECECQIEAVEPSAAAGAEE